MGAGGASEPQGAAIAIARGRSPVQSEEEAAKARRLLRFGGELGSKSHAPHGDESRMSSNPPFADAGPGLEPRSRDGTMFANSTSSFAAGPGVGVDRRSRGGPWNIRDSVQAASNRHDSAGEPFGDADAADTLKSGPIHGYCPDMCPEVERGERERKGDLDKFERLEGNRNWTSRELAVKKYTRTAEQDAVLIRPLPVLRETMDHLLSILERGHQDDMLAVHNFLWDRMRAVRMDLRMQHIFGREAIIMHEQMIRFHILAMHELCEYSEGDGTAEIFNAHLNIEQMNKASVDLFQMYEDHARRGTPVESEAEFRGYYALLKLDEHPGYKVGASELSQDLGKMRPKIRAAPQIQFARDVANLTHEKNQDVENAGAMAEVLLWQDNIVYGRRPVWEDVFNDLAKKACRSQNYVKYFRLAEQATYLQACLMHAHFAKLRTQALAATYDSLQRNHGLPESVLMERLGMEGEDIEPLIQHHGLAIKYYEESYVVKVGSFLNENKDFPTRRSNLVERKRASTALLNVRGPDQRRQDIAFPLDGDVRRSVHRMVSRVESRLVSGEGPDIAPRGLPKSPLRQVSPASEAVTEVEMLDSVGNLPDGILQGDAVKTAEISSTPGEAEDAKQGMKRRIEETQLQTVEHQKRRITTHPDAFSQQADELARQAQAAAARQAQATAARQAQAAAAAAERKMQEDLRQAAQRKMEEELRQRKAQHAAEVTAGRQRLWLRRWRRIAAAKALERHRRSLALDSLIMGYPLTTTKIVGGAVNAAERNTLTKSIVEQQGSLLQQMWRRSVVDQQGSLLQQMWEPLDPKHLVRPVLQERNAGTRALDNEKTRLSYSYSAEEHVVGRLFQNQLTAEERASILNDGPVHCASPPLPVRQMASSRGLEEHLLGSRLQQSTNLPYTEYERVVDEMLEAFKQQHQQSSEERFREPSPGALEARPYSDDIMYSLDPSRFENLLDEALARTVPANCASSSEPCHQSVARWGK